MAGWENAFGEIATAAKQDTQQTTLAAIQSASESLLTAAAAIKVAAEAINTKTTTVNTGAIAGTVALDAPTLAALETTGVAVSNFPGTQPISATALPLPADAATETTLAALNVKVPALESGRLPVSLPPGSTGLTEEQLRAQALAVTSPAGTSPLADNDKLMLLLSGFSYIAQALEHVNGASGAWAATGPALRISLNAAQPLGTVSSLANQVADGGVPSNYNVYNLALANERSLLARI